MNSRSSAILNNYLGEHNHEVFELILNFQYHFWEEILKWEVYAHDKNELRYLLISGLRSEPSEENNSYTIRNSMMVASRRKLYLFTRWDRSTSLRSKDKAPRAIIFARRSENISSISAMQRSRNKLSDSSSSVTISFSLNIGMMSSAACSMVNISTTWRLVS